MDVCWASITTVAIFTILKQISIKLQLNMTKQSELTQTATSRPTSSTKYRQPWATPRVDREAHDRITVRKPLAKDQIKISYQFLLFKQNFTVKCIVTFFNHFHAHVTWNVRFQAETIDQSIFCFIKFAKGWTKFIFFATTLITLNTIN